MPTWSKVQEVARRLWHHAISYFLHYLSILTIGLLVAYFKSIRDDGTPLSYYLKTAIEWVTPMTIGFFAVSTASLFVIVIRQRRELKSLRDLQPTLAAFGVRAFSRHDTDDAKAADWQLICNDVKTASGNQSPLWILGATGKRTFGDHDAPLHAVLRKYEGPVRVLLVRPNSFGFLHRVEKLRANSDAYIEEILDSVECCRTLSRNGVDIEVRLYESMPIWKMLVTPQALWLQHYATSNHVDDTPAYGFTWVHMRPTLLDGFRSVFDKRWTQDGSKIVDLATFDRTRWQEQL